MVLTHIATAHAIDTCMKKYCILENKGNEKRRKVEKPKRTAVRTNAQTNLLFCIFPLPRIPVVEKELLKLSIVVNNNMQAVQWDTLQPMFQ